MGIWLSDGDLPLNQTKQEGQCLRKEGHLQEEAGGWLWLEQALERRDCGSESGPPEEKGRGPCQPQAKPGSDCCQ